MDGYQSRVRHAMHAVMHAEPSLCPMYALQPDCNKVHTVRNIEAMLGHHCAADMCLVKGAT